MWTYRACRMASLLTLYLVACGQSGGTLGTDGAPIDPRFFPSGEVSLRYALDLPAGNGPVPAVVFVHGSGRADRGRSVGATNPFVQRGIAVLRYDKRGVGESTGEYFGVGPANAEVALGTLAGDVVAAVRFLKRFPEIDPRRIGLLGNSQGGWIGPLAAARTGDISFMLMWSGPTVSVGLEIYYSDLAEQTVVSLDDVYPQLSQFDGPAGYDPMPVLEGLDVPSLWLFGGQDRSIPSRVDTVNMRHLQGLDLPYHFLMYPRGDHGLRDTQTGRHIDVWSDYVAWLRTQGVLRD